MLRYVCVVCMEVCVCFCFFFLIRNYYEYVFVLNPAVLIGPPLTKQKRPNQAFVMNSEGGLLLDSKTVCFPFVGVYF